MQVCVGRYYNIVGPEGKFWNDGREKAPAAMSRKVAATADGGIFDMWGDGEQTRSFLFIAECLEGSIRLMRSDWSGPVNIGSEEMVTISHLADLAMEIAGKHQTINYIDGPLREGLKKTYAWIDQQVDARRRDV